MKPEDSEPADGVVNESHPTMSNDLRGFLEENVLSNGEVVESLLEVAKNVEAATSAQLNTMSMVQFTTSAFAGAGIEQALINAESQRT